MYYGVILGSISADAPSPKTSSTRCLKEFDSDWKAVVNTEIGRRGECKGASFTDNNIQIGAKPQQPLDEVVGPYSSVDPNGI